MTDPVKLYNPNDNVTGRDGGPYLDEVEAREAEKRRAFVEDREPDLDNPPPTAGIPLNNGPQQFATVGINNLPSQGHRVGVGVVEGIEREGLARMEEKGGLVSREEIPSEFLEVDIEDAAEDSEDVEPHPADPTSGEGFSSDFDLDNEDN